MKSLYGFEITIDKSVQEKNRKLVTELKEDSAFAFRVRSQIDASTYMTQMFMQNRGATLDDHTGLYTHPAIQYIINEVLFKDKADGGVRWAKYYNPFPTAGFALALTAVSINLLHSNWLTKHSD